MLPKFYLIRFDGVKIPVTKIECTPQGEVRLINLADGGSCDADSLDTGEPEPIKMSKLVMEA